ncbi:MAG: outer membrane lipoprotein-sorting protein [Bdellovibrio sp.]|nr:outer membrane lipoprotein-sorting protein [Bdellovibrio sp.]
MKFLAAVVLVYSISSLVGVASTERKFSASQILKKADEVRNPGESYSMKVEVINGGTSDGSRSLFEVSVRGNDKTLIKTLEPARDRGRNMLMLKEDMWAFIPNLNRAVRISLAQKLTGQAANGDISRMRWSGDYTATIEGEDAHHWILFLTAEKKGLTYEKLRVWIEKGNFHPSKAEFLTLAGKPLKTALYTDYRNLAGGIRPGTIQIQDAIRQDQISSIHLKDVRIEEFPESVFNQNALK